MFATAWNQPAAKYGWGNRNKERGGRTPGLIRLAFSTYASPKYAQRQENSAIGRTSEYVVAKLYDRATAENAKAFLERLIAHASYKIYTVLTDNGIQFADSPKNRNDAAALLRGRPFDRKCKRHGIEHHLANLTIVYRQEGRTRA